MNMVRLAAVASGLALVAWPSAHGARLASSTAAYPAALDDHACTFSWANKTCVPEAFCSFQFEFGDLAFDQSCRLVPDKFARVPQQLHLAYAGAAAGTGMTVSWTTYAPVDDAAVWLGESEDALALVKPDRVTLQTKTYYKDDAYELINYHAVLQGLSPHTQYYYKVGSQATEAFQSATSFFTTARESATTDKFQIAVYGDFGVDENAAATLAFVTSTLTPARVDFIYHIGDISYADNAFLKSTELLGFFYEETYNRWMNALTPTMATVPYMVSVGNHEAECHSPLCFFSGSKKDQLGNYQAYNARFRMPSNESGGVQNMWYAFEDGPVHFTSISSETDYANAPKNSVTGRKYGGFGDQLAWLEADLKNADANRDKTPWLVVAMHRPIYTREQVDAEGNPTGTSAATQQAFEELFIKYKVDVVLAGHVHLYERQLPVKNGKPVLDGVSEDRKTYANPQAPVYLVTGAAGSTEGLTGAKPKYAPAWNAVFENTKYGVSLVDVTRSSLKWTFLSVSSGDVLDEVTITKS